jgi:phage protein D
MPEFTLQTSVEIDGVALDAAIEPLLEQVIVDDFLHQPDMFVLTFRDVERTVISDARLKIGSRVAIKATGIGGNAPESLIAGEVTAMEAEYTEGGSRAIVRGYDPSHRLHRGRRTRSFAGMKDSDIARQISQSLGVAVGMIDDSGPVLEHVSQANATDWEFLQGRAREIGFELAVNEGKFHFCKPAASARAPADGDYESADPLTLVFGQELIEFHPRLTSAEQVKEVVVRGWDPKSKQALVGRAPAVATSATLKSTPADLANKFGNPSYVSVDRPLATQAIVDATARALSDRIGSGFAEAQGLARGNPKLKAGAAISVGVVGEEFAGKYVITSSRHVFDKDGYRTRFVVSGRQDRSLLHLAGGSNGGGSAASGINGVVVALVTNNDDPDKGGRVKLKFPWLADDYESDWARLVSLGAGPDSGAVWLPEVNDEVLVAFEFGDIRRPYVVGGLWNGVDKPRLGGPLFDNGKVKRRGFVSRKGHRFVFLDSDGDAGIALLTSNDSLKIALKESATEIHVKSDGTILIESTGDLTIKGSANVSVEAGAQLTLKGATVTVSASGPVDIDGTPIQLN